MVDFRKYISKQKAELEKLQGKISLANHLRNNDNSLWRKSDKETRNGNHFADRLKAAREDSVYKKLSELIKEFPSINDYVFREYSFLYNCMLDLENRKMTKDTYDFLLNSSGDLIKLKASYSNEALDLQPLSK